MIRFDAHTLFQRHRGSESLKLNASASCIARIVNQWMDLVAIARICPVLVPGKE